jgi:murein DD-endopeptidase MepM/ murein hydrolase activator NlpD
MGNQGMGRHGLCRVAAIALLSSIAAACSSIPDEPAPVFMKGGMPRVAESGPGPAFAGPRPGIGEPPPGIGGPPPSAPMPRADRQITVERGQSLGKLAVQYHVAKQAIIAANHLEPPDYKVKIGSRLTIPGAAAPVQQAMVLGAASSGPDPDVIPLDDPPMPRASAAPPPPPAMPPPTAAALPPPRPVGVAPPGPPPTPPAPPPIATALPPPRPVGVPPPGPPPQPTPPPIATAVPPPAPASPGPGRPIAFPPREPSAAEEARAEPAAPAAAGPVQSRGGHFPWPVRGRVLASYGVAADGTHNDGINIAAARGTAVTSVESGIVAYSGNELRGYGNLVLVKHTNGWISAYAHCDEILVRKGDPVYRGQTIAKVGTTGGVTEPQLHFELRQGKRPVDPRGFLDPAPSA